MSNYEKEQIDKIKAVVRAALMNPSYGNEVNISTQGSNPSMSVYVQAYILAKALGMKDG